MDEPDIRKMGISDIRANMTEVIAAVRLLGQPVALTRREKPQAMLISMDRWKAAVLDAEIRPIYDELIPVMYELVKDPAVAERLKKTAPALLSLLETKAL